MNSDSFFLGTDTHSPEYHMGFEQYVEDYYTAANPLKFCPKGKLRLILFLL